VRVCREFALTRAQLLVHLPLLLHLPERVRGLRDVYPPFMDVSFVFTTQRNVLFTTLRTPAPRRDADWAGGERARERGEREQVTSRELHAALQRCRAACRERGRSWQAAYEMRCSAGARACVLLCEGVVHTAGYAGMFWP